jgi:hypothetical protein
MLIFIKTTVFVLFFLISSSLYGEFTNETPPKHFFNAYLFKSDERQFDVWGNFRLGMTEDWEVGTNIYLTYLAFRERGVIRFPRSGLNLFVKHKMFEGQN